MSNSEIFSSTGSLGVSRRPFERVYINGEFSDNVDSFFINLQKMIGFLERKSHRFSRIVYKGVVSTEIYQQLVQSSYKSHIEVAMPLDEYGHRNCWLIYIGVNIPQRVSLDPGVYTLDTSAYLRNPTENASYIKQKEIALKREGFKFISSIDHSHVDDIFRLWSQTFGWSRSEIVNLVNKFRFRKRIDERDNMYTWVSAAVFSEKIVSIAMAERLDLQSSHSGTITTIESTEWKTDPDYCSLGLMSIILFKLNVEILNSFKTQPLIYSECNYLSRSDIPASTAGFQIPSREYAPQVLVQNVRVISDQEMTQGYNDFTFLYVPLKIK